MKGARATARITADVNPEVKEKLISLSKGMERSMTDILTALIEAAFNEFNK
jgi:predicted DNA-binding protein